MHITIDLSDGTPIYEQLIGSLKGLVNRGKLRPGDRLPTVRQLAQDLGVNLNTVARAYRELARQGVMTVRQGRGASVVSSKGRCDAPARQGLKRMTARLVNEAVFLGIEPKALHGLINSELKNFDRARS